MDATFQQLLKGVDLLRVEWVVMNELVDYHRGRERAINRRQLVAALAQRGQRVHERVLRECIKQLRRKGALICSAPGEDGGYWLAASRQEYLEFRQAEYAAKIADMSETMRAMDIAAQQAFTTTTQERLI